MPTEERRGHAVEQRTGLVVRMPTLLRDVGMAPGNGKKYHPRLDESGNRIDTHNSGEFVDSIPGLGE